MAVESQKALIAAVGAFISAARANGSLPPVQGSGAPVYYGYDSKRQAIPLNAYPYVLIEDGGERTEVVTGNAQKRWFGVEVEFMAYFQKVENSLDYVLDFSSKLKAVFELEANRLMDGMTFGVTITPILYEDEQKGYYRGRRVRIEYHLLEDIFEQY